MNSPRTAIVTGASGNLGKAVTSQLLTDGFQVVGTVLHPDEKDTKLEHKRYEVYQADVSKEAEVEQLVNYVSGKYQQLDLACLLVGGFAMAPLEETPLAEVEKMFKLNFHTAYLCSQKLYKMMKAQKNEGHILFVGARPSLQSEAAASMVSYSLSKSLLFELSNIINAKTSETGVRSSILVPSVLDTPPNRDSMPDADFDNWVTPEQVAEVVSFLASPQSQPLRQTILKVYGNA
jgi:NAD(P)-dependent dehydrogenase (short-subunit alcohol dehydrogenase family)